MPAPYPAPPALAVQFLVVVSAWPYPFLPGSAGVLLRVRQSRRASEVGAKQVGEGRAGASRGDAEGAGLSRWAGRVGTKRGVNAHRGGVKQVGEEGAGPSGVVADRSGAN